MNSGPQNIIRLLTSGTAILLLMCLLYRCGDPSGLQLPEPSSVSIQESSDLESVFRLPIHFRFTTLEAFLNEKFQGEFLKTVIQPHQSKHLNIDLSIRKINKIRIYRKDDEIFLKVPLQIKAQLSEKNLLHKDLSLKPVEAEVSILMSTPLNLSREWHLEPKLQIRKIDWEKRPEFVILKNKIDLTGRINDYINDHQQQLTEVLDQEINKAVSLRTPVEKIWTDLQKPILINRKGIPAYLQFRCREIQGNIILADTGIVCNTQIFSPLVISTSGDTGYTPRPLPLFAQLTHADSVSTAGLNAFVSFEEIETLISGLIAKKPLEYQGHQIHISNIRSYGSVKGITVVMDFNGSISGSLVASGKPLYHTDQQNIHISDFDFQISSDNRLLSAGDQLLHHFLRDTLNKVLTFGLKKQIDRLPSIITAAISKGKTGKSIAVGIDRFRVESCEFIVTEKVLQVIAGVSFEGLLEVTHLNAGKKVKIRGKSVRKSAS